jgi:hypothetical protein
MTRPPDAAASRRQSLFLLDTLDAKLAATQSTEDIIALYNATIPAGPFRIPLPNGPAQLGQRARVTSREANTCAGAVQFIIAYVVAAQGTNAFDAIVTVNDGQSAANSAVLTAGTAANLLDNVMALGGDYIGLLTADPAGSFMGGIGHTAIFVSYGWCCLSRTWAFYQANATAADGFPKFTLSKTVNARRGVPDMNLTNMDEAEFRRFFLGLPVPGRVRVLPTAGRAACQSWFLNVVRFNGTELIPP